MPDGKAVQTMFSDISGKYDAANHILSGGIDVYWRWRLVRAVKRCKPASVVDLATGSGDVAFALRRALPDNCPVTGLDFCEPMLDMARKKQANRKLRGELSFSFGDAMQLQLPDDSAGALTIAFGLRNFEDRAKGLKEIHRVLEPDQGTLFVLEFSQPYTLLKPFYGFYLRTILPFFAKLATGNRSAYEYLAGSIESFPDRQSLSEELTAAGFRDVRAIGLTGSIVALHSARA
jgi:demethylmenaquinone methyltransferase/2-methoxy-6-polyprenyl-1,4-benzoquinol methylase